jgi:hypothetical protein
MFEVGNAVIRKDAGLWPPPSVQTSPGVAPVTTPPAPRPRLMTVVGIDGESIRCRLFDGVKTVEEVIPAADLRRVR